MPRGAIQISELGYAYRPGGERIFDKLSVQVDPKEWLGIVGPSGCGKSTLVRLLAGLIEPSVGSIKIDNALPSDHHRLGRFGLALQEHALVPWLSVRFNIGLPAEQEAGDVGERAAKVAAFFGLSDRLSYLPSELSGGMVARVALARSLLKDPDFVFWDEPFASLDDITIARICMFLLRLRNDRQFSLVLVSHQLETIARLSDRCLCFPKELGGAFEILDLEGYGPPSKRGASEYSAIRRAILEKYL